jgi:hypothetical protein
VADYQGYLHWLDKQTGELVAREHIAKFRVSNPPLAVKDTVVVLTDSGKLAAYRATPRVAVAAGPAAAPPATPERPPAAQPPTEQPPTAPPTPAPTPP